jgi:hypothetical protein
MEIHILRNGEHIGPFTEETVQSLLKQGNILINDLAWAPGLTGWSPLHAVLYPAAQPPAAPANTVPPPMPPAPAISQEVEVPAVPEPQPAPEPETGELATFRQKAFLTFMAVPFSTDLSKDRAVQLVKDAMENPKNSARVKRWDDERLRLYPDLFADEIKARKENRAQQYFEICQAEGTEFFESVTKAHTKVLVGYLDVQYPTWDQSEHAAKYDYFFPAIAEKFPQLVKRTAKGRFKYPDGPKVAAELVRNPGAVRAKARKSQVKAIVRGVVWGAVVLAIAVGAVEFQRRGGSEAFKVWLAKAQAQTKPAAKKAGASNPAAFTEASAKIATTTAPVPGLPNEIKASPPKLAQASPGTQAAPVAPLVPGPIPPAPTPLTTAPAAPADPTMVANTSPPPALPANVSLFDTTPPPAAPPANDSIKAPTTLPTPPAAPQRVFAKVTKPTVISLRFGTSTLRVGTPVQVLSASGANLTIKFGPETATIPTANTDYNGVSSMVAAPPGQ